jgi:5'-3' exonuclease
MENVILVDSSYTSFYRFFATLRWFSFANKDEYKEFKGDAKYDWSKNEVFIEKYKKMYLESIIKLVGKKVYNKSKVIFCLDTPKEQVWRSKLMDDYKGERADLSLKNNFKPTFQLTYNELIPNLIEQNPDKITSIRVPEIEADDVIALTVKYIRQKKIDVNVFLISGDEDFKQLGYDRLSFLDYKKNKKPITLTEAEAEESLINKIICGDNSDNIKCIFPKDKKLVSNALRKKVKESRDELDKFLKDNPESLKKFNLNRKLIDFEYIPKKYHSKVFKLVKKFLSK